MGFETRRRSRQNRGYFIWSIPMGFETWWKLLAANKYNKFEVSLWDLKPPAGLSLPSTKSNLKYPYGIWNFAYRERQGACGHLKYPYGIWNSTSTTSKSRIFHLKYPYGIWNWRNHKSVGHARSIWSIPMGFETTEMRFSQSHFPFEVSLWDLKQYSNHLMIIISPYLKYPYGIWNFGSRHPCLPRLWFEVSLWDLKLINASKRSFARLIWSIPMGFETVSAILTNGVIFRFEVSLWDLKLPFVFSIFHLL